MGFFSKIFKKKNKTTTTSNIVVVSEEIKEIVDALGGINNIVAFNNCTTKLRYDIKDSDKVNKEKLTALGALDIVLFGPRHIQVKFGERAEELNLEIQRAQETLKIEAAKNIKLETGNLLEKSKENDAKNPVEQECQKVIYAPCAGEWKSLEELPDKIFSQKTLGNGYAISPSTTGKLLIHSPIDGKIETNFSTKHAFGIKACGLEVLLHIGIGTVKLNGIGFKSFVNQNEMVKKGQKLVEVDLKKLKEANVLSTDIIVIVTDEKNKESQLKLLCSKKIDQAEQPWFEII
ncbi:glucose PTS transporter subunit IIA [Mycoplasmopsis hyopharyngis]|uniref:glucose PTS transporter subunit IIA n=1 Tax=Mycoplasmopsis hyopharyngis TaxID=29558 RepID=UPI003872CE00